MGWQNGISSWVRLAAMVPAMIAVWNTGPFGVRISPSAKAARTTGGRITRAWACAVRRVTALPLTSTIVGWFDSSTWDSIGRL